jgi:hypothetical protein
MDGIQHPTAAGHRSERPSAVAANVGRSLALALLAGMLAIAAGPRAAIANVSSGGVRDVPSGRQLGAGYTTIPDAQADASLKSEGTIALRRGDRSRLTILDAVPPKNFEMRLRLKALPGAAQDIGGVAIRLTERGNYYVLKIDFATSRVAFARVADGRSTEIIGVDSNLALDAWHTLAIRAEDGRFGVSLDGHWLFTAYDETLRQPGRIAFWREPGSTMQFDPIVIEPLPMTGRP